MNLEIRNIIEIWPKWKILQIIENSSSGTVYKACKEETEYTAWAAIKVIRIPKDESELRVRKQEGMDDISIQYYYQNVIWEFLNKINVMELLKPLNNIVRIEECYIKRRENRPEWYIYIRMELLEGLLSYIERKPLSVEEIVKLGIDICEALKICEAHNIIHGDIKPDNIFVDQFGTFKLGDFGIGKRMENSQTKLYQKETSMYVAPEFYRDGVVGKTADIYALGIILHNLMGAGRFRFPFMPSYYQLATLNLKDQALYRQLNGKSASTLCGLGSTLEAVVAKACAPDPRIRYQTAQEFQRDLIQWRDFSANKIWEFPGNTLTKCISFGQMRIEEDSVSGNNPGQIMDSALAQSRDMIENPMPKNTVSGAKIAIWIAIGFCVLVLCFFCGYTLLNSRQLFENEMAENISRTQTAEDVSPATADFTGDSLADTSEAEINDNEDQRETDEVEGSYIGIQVTTVSSEMSQLYDIPEGVYVYSVVNNGPAQAAGIIEGDVIIDVEGHRIANTDQLIEALSYYTSGETVGVTILRNSDGEYNAWLMAVTLASFDDADTGFDD